MWNQLNSQLSKFPFGEKGLIKDQSDKKTILHILMLADQERENYEYRTE